MTTPVLRTRTTVTGGERFYAAIERLQQERQQALVAAINARIVTEIIPELQARTAKRTRKLERSYRTRVNIRDNSITLFSGVHYALAARFTNAPLGDRTVAQIVEDIANARIGKIAAEEISKLV